MNHALPGFPRTWPQPHIASDGVSRRDFVRVCTMAAAAVGLSGSAAAQIAEAAVKGLKASVVWLHFQGDGLGVQEWLEWLAVRHAKTCRPLLKTS